MYISTQHKCQSLSQSTGSNYRFTTGEEKNQREKKTDEGHYSLEASRVAVSILCGMISPQTTTFRWCAQFNFRLSHGVITASLSTYHTPLLSRSVKPCHKLHALS